MTNSTLSLLNRAMNNANTTTNTNEEQPMTNTTKTYELNTNALSSTLTANIFHKTNNPRLSVLIGCAVVDAVQLVGEMDLQEAFFEMVEQALESAKLTSTVSGEGAITTTTHTESIESGDLEDLLLGLGYLTEDGTMGERLQELLMQRTEAYAPTNVEHEFTRRFPETPEKGQGSALTTEAILALESSQFTIDAAMLAIANQVQKLTGGAEKDDEAYVLAGCNMMGAENAYTSEFKTDRRSRLYQAACHGPNGQASDRSRALMDLANVTTDYDVDTVKKAIKDEVMDMVGVPMSEVGKLMFKAVNNPVEFIMGQLAMLKKDRQAKKPWSFVKAAMIWSELNKGNRPYIGMAVGLDAKCSGPQLGALMAGDAEVAQACGMTLLSEQDMIDAYERAIAELDKAGLHGFTRNGVKKSFMGIFYGQGWAAFTDTKQLVKDEQFEIVNNLYPNGVVSDDVAKAFHKAITKSFGAKMVAVRARFKEFQDKVEGRIGHTMPDGFKVQMNYKVKENILGEVLEHGVVCPDVQVTTESNTYKFIKFAVKTLEVHTSDFVRNGFVNMIQATDALIAKLIIVHLKRLGAQHIVAVHDCFRVNVTEMHLLRQAIINAYMDLFGTKANCKTADLPMGTDILGMYFEGASKALRANEEKVVPISQFITLKTRGQLRRMNKIEGVDLDVVIKSLGQSYYFAK